MDRDDRVLAFVQGRLSADEMQAVEREMAEDRALAVEVAAMRGIKAEFEVEAAVLADEAAADAGWARLEKAIDAEAPGQPANSNRAPRFSIWQTGGLIAASLALWQVVAVPMLSPPSQTGYSPVSEAISAPVLQVMFAAGADMGEVTGLLTSSGGMILSGPSAIGLYRVAFETDGARDAALGVFEGRPDIVEMVAVD